MLISTRCIHGFMSNLIKKSWTDSIAHARSNSSLFQPVCTDFRPPFSCMFYSIKKKSSMKPEDVTTVEKASPPSKKARTADFSSVVKRSHSVTENSILDIMNDSIGKFREKVINDR